VSTKARRQDMKWCGVFFVKKWTFPQRRVHYVIMYTIGTFYFTFYLFGCIRTQRTPRLRAWHRLKAVVVGFQRLRRHQLP